MQHVPEGNIPFGDANFRKGKTKMKKSKLLEPVISSAHSPMGITINAMNFFRKVREQHIENNFQHIQHNAVISGLRLSEGK